MKPVLLNYSLLGMTTGPNCLLVSNILIVQLKSHNLFTQGHLSESIWISVRPGFNLIMQTIQQCNQKVLRLSTDI